MAHDVVLGFKKLFDDAVLPTYAHEGDACMDLYPHSIGHHPNGSVIVGLGLAAHIPAGYALMIYSRSGMGFKRSERLANCVGVIDSGYKGEIKVRIMRDEPGAPEVEHDVACAQAMLIPIPRVHITEIQDVGESDRGIGGFGSSDKIA